MAEFPIEQALYHRADGGAPSRMAQSLGFRGEWHAEAERLVLGFGDRPAGVKCPPAVFAQRLGRQHVAVVHVADQAGGVLGFFFLIVPRSAYYRYLGDPFVVAARLAPDWISRG